MKKIINKGKTDKYVYDISLDGSVINALGNNIMSNTDGFNFSYPMTDKLRYNDEHPYISNGAGRNSVKDKKYTGVEADVAEFEDIYFNHAWNGGVNKMGLGIDEWCQACIQFARKNYADYMPDESTKKVGNTIKSRKMSGYLEKFIDKGVDMLLHKKGYEFLESYYNYVSDIFSYKIPIKDIASKGNIKKELDEYKKDCNTLTKAGAKKARQAWYELAIRTGKKYNISDTVYYINTGLKKGDSDVKRTTHKYTMIDGKEEEIKGKLTRQLLLKDCEALNIAYKDLKTKAKNDMLKKYIVREEDEISLNCMIVPKEILTSEEDILCSQTEELGYGTIEYNVDKYISQFNNRVKPLLTCFSYDIRDQILITNPKDRQYFTKEQSELVNGQPNKPTDQDTYEALMAPERKEIEYWQKIGKKPPFIEECGIDWNKIVEKLETEKKDETNKLFIVENEKYLKALDEITNDDVENFYTEGIIPAKIAAICDVGKNMHFTFKKLPNKTPSTGGSIVDDISVMNKESE